MLLHGRIDFSKSLTSVSCALTSVSGGRGVDADVACRPPLQDRAPALRALLQRSPVRARYHSRGARREVLEGANELRIMLCKDKVVTTANGQKKGTSVIAACGACGTATGGACCDGPLAIRGLL